MTEISVRCALALLLTLALLPVPASAQLPPAPHAPTPGEAEPWEPDAPTPPAVELEPLPPVIRFRARADYLYGWFKDMPLPPVLTTGLVTDDFPGQLGQPGTKILFGGLPIDESNHVGISSSLAWWVGPAGAFGAELAGFYLVPRARVIDYSSDGSALSPVLAQPFFNALANTEDISILALPGRAAGSLHADVAIRMWGTEANGLANLYEWRGLRIDALAGFRYLNVRESVEMLAQSTGLPGVPVMGGVHTVGSDSFRVDNNFYGGQLGLRGKLRSGRYFVEAQTKLALGATATALDIAGQTTLQAAGGAPQSFVGGLYALSSNIGHYTTSNFAVLPEGNIDLGWQPLDHVTFRLGYRLLYLSKLARAGAQVDRRLNPNLIPGSTTFGFPGGPALPSATPIRDFDFWLQGFTVGMELTF